MNPVLLRATNLRRFPTLEWEIPEGTAAIIGPNGAGKSTLLNAVELALFADGARDLAGALGPHGDRLEIELTFTHDGETYRIRRGYDGRGRGKATLDFELSNDLDGGHWIPLTRERATETQLLIESTLGLSRATFNASAFLAQGDSANFPLASPADRKALIGELLDPYRLWPKLHERVREEAKVLEAGLAGDAARIAEKEVVAADRRDLEVGEIVCERDVVAARSAYDSAAEALEDAQTALAANEAAAERYRAAVTARATARSESDRAERELATAKGATDLLLVEHERATALTAKAKIVPELETKVETQREAATILDVDRRRKAEAQAAVDWQNARASELDRDLIASRERLKTATAKLAHLEGSPADTERCDRCQQHLGVEARKAAIHSLTLETGELDEHVSARVAALEEAFKLLAILERDYAAIILTEPTDRTDYPALLAAARGSAQELAGLEVTIRGLEEQAGHVPALTEALATAETALADRVALSASLQVERADEAELARAVTDARTALSLARAGLDEANAQVVRIGEQLARARQAETELAALRETTATRHARLDLLRLAERAYGRDGIPALIAENTIPAIETEANRILERLPTSDGTVLRLELQTQRALKTSDALKETLDILVSDRSTTREFLTFSGGERFRVSFALRWALAKLLRNRRGARSDLLVIDEPDGLDAGGMDGLAEILREEAGSFSRVLVVSHNPLLASAFEGVVEVVSDGEVSRIVREVERREVV